MEPSDTARVGVRPPTRAHYAALRILQALAIVGWIAASRGVVGDVLDPARPAWMTPVALGAAFVVSTMCAAVWVSYRRRELAVEFARLAATAEQLSTKITDMQEAFDAGRRYAEATTADPRLRSVN